MSLMMLAPAFTARRATSGEKVSALMGTSVAAARPATAGTRRAASSAAATGAPARAGTAPTSSSSKPASARRNPSATARSGVPLRAPSKNESSVTFTIPAPSGAERSSSRSSSVQEVARDFRMA